MSIFSDGMFDRVPAKDKLIGVGIIAIPIATLVLLAILFLKPIPINATSVAGCYEADGAPALEVQKDIIRIAEPAHPILKYVPEPAKLGYRLSVSPAFSLRPTGTGKYNFVADERGIGYFWPLLAKQSDDPANLRDPKDYSGRFQVIARDGTTITYHRSTSPNGCAGTD